MELEADLALEDQVDQLLDPTWLSPEKKSDRQEFIDNYQNLFFLTDSNASNQSISETALSSHALFSYTIHDHLKPQQGEFSNLLQALVGKGKPINTSHKKKILWFKLEALKTAQITQPFQNKNLLPATENIICNVLTRQLDALRLAAQEYFFDEQANFSEVFKKLCEKFHYKVSDFDIIELNEAFAAQALGCMKELNLEPSKINRNGGSIAIGHPLGASGTRILTTLIHQMKKDPSLKKGLATMCIGVGQGIALSVERC
jgi:hypothetical protein